MTTKPKTSVSTSKPRGRLAKATSAKLATPRVQRQIRRQGRPVNDGGNSETTPVLETATLQAQTAISKPPRETRVQQVLTLLSRPDGASLAELQAATGWQAHSARGFLSGVIRKLAGVDLTSTKSTDGPRRSFITTQPQ
jgi:hypothetical protein